MSNQNVVKISEQLKAGKALIENPDNWLQGVYADNTIDLDKATCFCSAGATIKILGGKGVLDISDSNTLNMAIALANGFSHPAVVIDFNDEHTHAEVMVMWDKAIELAEKDGI